MSFVKALKAAWQGIEATLKTERNFKIHSVCALLAIVLGFLLKIDTSEWLWITIAIVMVLAAELFNTALEAITNLASPTIHPLAKKAKDAAAGAVLLAAIFALICGLLIFLPKLVML